MAAEDHKEAMTHRAQLVRIHEANCGIEHPTDEERAFRSSIMRKLGMEFGLREMRNVTFMPGRPAPAATPAPAKK
jgi:hypothetical protein